MDAAFNDVTLLAEVVAKGDGAAVAHRVLKHIKPTPQQVGLSQAERAANVRARSPFRPSPGGGGGAKALLVDDVLTSSARSMPARARFFARGRHGSTCWSLPGLSRRTNSHITSKSRPAPDDHA